MVTVRIDEYTLLQLLMDRYAEYWNNGDTHDDTYKLFETYYENLINEGAFENCEFDPMVIVDNDYVNYTNIVTEDEIINDYGYASVEDAYDDGVILAEYNDIYLISTT